MYFLYSKHYESIISNSWDNKPETGQYALYQDECTVLVKIIGKNLEPIRLNDITNEPVNSGENIKIYDDIVYKIVTVSFDRNCSMDSLVSSYLINEPNKTGYITNQMEPYIDLYDENPLPIEA